jgi:hypothetical protein
MYGFFYSISGRLLSVIHAAAGGVPGAVGEKDPAEAP